MIRISDVMQKILLVVTLCFLGRICIAQNTRNTEMPKLSGIQHQTSKIENKRLFKSSKKKNKIRRSTPKSEVEEFRARLKKVYKKKRKEEKLADKKRYKEHGYFGHKKPPKKRPPGRQKFCKVCRIKH